MTFRLRFLTILLLLTLPAFLFAADGQTLFRENCKVCHGKGSKNGVYTPMSFTQDQWRRFFATKLVPSHKSAIHPVTHKNLLEGLTPAEMKALQNFAVDHAADSEQPATCG
ncbi:MAG: cytochrome c [Acidobacteriota bacterium]|nr:cytochrome c [Acidobacteriota bacterium]